MIFRIPEAGSSVYEAVATGVGAAGVVALAGAAAGAAALAGDADGLKLIISSFTIAP